MSVLSCPSPLGVKPPNPALFPFLCPRGSLLEASCLLLGFPSLMGHSLGHLDLQVLETCVKNCGHRFHVLVANQDFVENVLVRTILPKNNPPTIVHDKVLNLIQVCSLAG